MEGTNLHRVPVSKSGEYGWTLCCGACAETMLDPHDPRPMISGPEGKGVIVYCKKCYEEVDTFLLPGLDLVIWRMERAGYAYSPEAIEAAIEGQGRLIELLARNEARRVPV